MKPSFKLLLTDENYKDRVHTQTDTQTEREIQLHERETQTHPLTNRHTDRQERKKHSIKSFFNYYLQKLNFTKTLNKASF